MQPLLMQTSLCRMHRMLVVQNVVLRKLAGTVAYECTHCACPQQSFCGYAKEGHEQWSLREAVHFEVEALHSNFEMLHFNIVRVSAWPYVSTSVRPYVCTSVSLYVPHILTSVCPYVHTCMCPYFPSDVKVK